MSITPKVSARFRADHEEQILPAIYYKGVCILPLQEVLTAISTVGFPIAACVALFWFNYKQTEQHREETQKLAETINNNTLALTKLAEKIQHLEEVKNNG